MADVVDLTHVLSEGNMTEFPGDPVYCCKSHATIEQDGYQLSSLSLGTHTGTHIDAPSHFFGDGKSLSDLSMRDLIGPVVVLDVRHKTERQRIIWEELKPLVESYGGQFRPHTIVVVMTGWSTYYGTPKYLDHPFLDAEAAEKLLSMGAGVIGIDAMSPDETMLEGHPKYAVHEVVLGAGKILAENLTNVAALLGDTTGEEGQWTMSLFPLNIDGGDGSPVRAVAFRQIDHSS